MTTSNSCTVSHSYEHLKTGDLLLCDNLGHSGLGLFGWLIKYFTYSDYSHIAMIIKDPQFTKEPLDGLFVWEAGFTSSDVNDAEDNIHKSGVQIVPLSTFLQKYEGKVYVRKIETPDIDTYEHIFNTESLRKIHDVVYDKPYDLVLSDWLSIYAQHDKKPQKTNRFVCSSLVGYIYSKLGLLPSTIDWSILSPAFFSSDNKSFPLVAGFSLHKEKEISSMT